MIFWNIRNPSPNNTTLHPKRPEFSAALLIERHVSCSFRYVQRQTQAKLISVDVVSSSPFILTLIMWNGIWFSELYSIKFCGIVHWLFQVNGWHSCLYLQCCRIISQVQKLATLIENFPGVVPRTEYFILFCSILILNYLSYAESSVGTAGYISQLNKQEGQITYHSHSNSKVVGTAENCC